MNEMLNETNLVSMAFERCANKLRFMKYFKAIKDKTRRAINRLWSALPVGGQVEELCHKARLPVICAYYYV